MKKNKLAMIAGVLMLALSMLACSLGGAKETEVPTQPPVVATVAAPTQPPAPTQVPPTAKPMNQNTGGDLEIIDPIFYMDSYGYYHVVGLVKNNSDRALDSIELTIEAKDASGVSMLKDTDDVVVDTLTFYPLLTNLFPGEVAPFDYYLYVEDRQEPATVNVTPTGSLSSSEKRADVSVENAELFLGDQGAFYISGELINNSSNGVKVDSLAGAVLDDNGNLVAADWSYSYSYYLAPSGDEGGMDRAPFVISLDGPESAYSKYQVYVDAIDTDEIPIQEIYVDLTNNYFDDYGDFHIVGTLENGSSEIYTAYLVTGLYDENNVVLDAVSSSVAIYLEPGAIVPFDVTYFSVVGYNPAQADRVDTFTVQIDPYWTYESPYEVVTLTSINATDQVDGATWTFTGDVTNDSGQELSWATVVVEVYDGDLLVATDYYTLYPEDDSIAPGDVETFDFTLYGDPTLDASTLTYKFTAQGAVK